MVETEMQEIQESSSVENIKQELAEMYVDFLDQQKEGVISLWASLWANLNPLKKDAIAYLVGEETAQEKSDIFSKLKKNLKKKLIERATGGTFLEYNTASLNKMKALINQYKNDKAKLEQLKLQIEEGKDPTSEQLAPSPTQDTSETPNAQEAGPQVAPVVATSMILDEQLQANKEISQEEKTYIQTNIKQSVEALKQKWSLTDITQIKDMQGNRVLQCNGETPYINTEVIYDLAGLALLYYKKTGTPLIIESGYRTIDHQQQLKQDNKKSWVPTADAWYSGHNMWYSLDMSKETRYADKIGWVKWLQDIAKTFNFYPISSEDRHFDHKKFVDTYYDNKEARLPLAQKIDQEYTQYVA